MPTRGSKDVKPKYIEFPAELYDQIQAFADERGQSFKAVVVDAARRHLAHPPKPVEIEPLPDVVPEPKKRKKS